MLHPSILHHDDAGVALHWADLCRRRAAIEVHVALHGLRNHKERFQSQHALQSNAVIAREFSAADANTPEHTLGALLPC